MKEWIRGRGLRRICDTNLQDRQAFPLGKAFLLSRLSGLGGNTQSNSRFAAEQGPHLGERPSHFWQTGVRLERSGGGRDIIAHHFPFAVGMVALGEGNGARGGQGGLTDMACKSCALGRCRDDRT